MARNRYGVGTTVLAGAAFSDPHDTTAPIDPKTKHTYLDPNTVTVNCRCPDGTYILYTYGVDAELVRLAQGRYECSIPLTMVGTYRWTWTATTPTKSLVIFGECDATLR